MGEIVQSLEDGSYLYRLSSDILMLIRRNAHVVAEAADGALAFHLNLSSIFLAGSFLEATLNEEIALCAHSKNQNIEPTLTFWVTLNEMQKSLPITDKWDLIAATRGGQKWDRAREPFQSHDTLMTLRNELVHFKGRYTRDDAPPINRLRDLATQFKTTRDWKLEAMGIDPWLVAIVKSKKLGLWIDSTIFSLYSQIEELLFGKILSPAQKAVKQMKIERYGISPQLVRKSKRRTKSS
jgi:hypothetical protein